MDGNIPTDPEQMQFCQNFHLVPSTPEFKPSLIQNCDSISDKASLFSYQDDDKYSSTALTPSEFDYSPKRRTNKQRICTKHATHTKDELEKCLELMEKNRIASLKSRRKKLTTIDEQKEKIQHLENELKQARAIIRKQDVEKNQIKAENQELRAMVIALQSQMAQLVRATEASSDAEIIDVEKVDEEKVTNSVENVSNMMQSATISQEPMYFNPDVINLFRMVSPEFDREVHNILNSPLTSPLNQVLEQQNQAKPPLIVTKEKTIQYAPKPGSLILEDGFEHNPTKYHSPLFQKIVYQFYGESPIKLVNPVTSTSKENQK